MTQHSLYEAETKTIGKAQKIIEDHADSDHPLYQAYVELATDYQRLFKHFTRIVKINDKQQKQLLASKEAIEKANEELTQLNATKDKFFSIVAHDLKSPINSFLNVATLLVDYIHRFSQEDIQNMARNVRTSGTNLMKLMENLLNWSRMQMQREEFNPQECRYAQLAASTIAILRPWAEEKEIELFVDIAEDIQVFADPNMMSSVLQNLIANAIKFTPRGGRVEIGCRRRDDWVQTTIRDTGIGIAEENLNKLFRIDVIYTDLGTENEKGTGLGLILCQEMVQRHGGRIWVESEKEQGTTFHFTSPTSSTASGSRT